MIRHDLIERLRVPPGKKVRLKDYDPGWAQTKEMKELGKDVVKARAQEILAAEPGRSRGSPGAPVRERRVLGAGLPPGDGRGGQGRHDQARDDRRESAGRAGLRVQGAVGRGARSQLPVALHEGAAGARPDRHLQPLVLRGRAGRPGASRVARAPEASAGQTRPEVLEGSLRGHQRLRAAPRPERNR